MIHVPFVLLALAVTAPETPPLLTPPFDGAGSTWSSHAPTGAVTRVADEVEISVPPDAEVGWPQAYADFPAAPGVYYEGAATVASGLILGGYGAYLSIEFQDDAGRRLIFEQSAPAFPDQAPGPLSVRAAAPPGTDRGRFCLVLHGRGTARYRNAVLRMVRPPLGPAYTGSVPDGLPMGTVVLSPAWDTAGATPLWGIGFEDDGWFYMPENTALGVTERDHALRAERIRVLDPDWVRMFVWYPEWNPSGDWTAFDFDTPGMESHRRSLDIYQALGTPVTLTGVEWEMKHVYDDPEGLARTVGALFEHLIRERGYTCVKHWILTNEPNTHWFRHGVGFARYVEIHERVRDEFARRGLDVKILGSDDTNGGMPWFARCAASPAYDAAVSAYASHLYLKRDALDAAAWFFDDRTALLAGRKPWLVAEFGFQDARSGVVDNPLMDEFDYALLTSAFVIDGLNRGAAGFSFWCLHEMLYPIGVFMNYGLWRMPAAIRPATAPPAPTPDPEPWPRRPVYHALANFTVRTEPGMPIARVDSADPGRIRAAAVGDTLFWVNLSAREETVAVLAPRGTQVQGSTAAQAEPAPLPAHTGSGGAAPLVFTAPARSFGTVHR